MNSELAGSHSSELKTRKRLCLRHRVKLLRREDITNMQFCSEIFEVYNIAPYVGLYVMFKN